MQCKNDLLGLPKQEMPGDFVQSSKGPVSHLMFCVELSYIIFCSCINAAQHGLTYSCLAFFLKLVVLPWISKASSFPLPAIALCLSVTWCTVMMSVSTE